MLLAAFCLSSRNRCPNRRVTPQLHLECQSAFIFPLAEADVHSSTKEAENKGRILTLDMELFVLLAEQCL